MYVFFVPAILIPLNDKITEKAFGGKKNEEDEQSNKNNTFTAEVFVPLPHVILKLHCRSVLEYFFIVLIRIIVVSRG